MINYDNFDLSLHHLKILYNQYLQSDELSDILKEAVREATIHRFETCFDSLWKSLKKYMKINLALADIPNSPNPIFIIAGENHLITDVAQFMRYGAARIATTHDYSYKKSLETLDIIGDFIHDAQKIHDIIIKK